MGDPSARLPPLRGDRSSSPQPPGLTGHAIHQVQLEREYEAAESDEDNDKQYLNGWLSYLRRNASAVPDETVDPAARDIYCLCVFESPDKFVPPQLRSPLIDGLRHLPPRRLWARWRWREQPPVSQLHVAEALVLYEKGIQQTMNKRCKRCRAGDGPSPQCVVVPDDLRNPHRPGPCSNCLCDGAGDTCNAAGRPAAREYRREAGRQSTQDSESIPDHLVVLSMIAKAHGPSGSFDDHATRARQIESAALYIARAARRWGQELGRGS